MKYGKSVVPYPYRSREEWLSIRRSMVSRVGGSSISAIMGLNPYESAAHVFYRKLGLHPDVSDNVAMFTGRIMEDVIADVWQYADINAPDVQRSIIDNYESRRIIRRCRKVNAILTNSKYPWLFASLDRVFRNNDGQMGVLEVKTIGEWAGNQWEAGIPPGYLVQIQTYLAVTEYKYGEICLLHGGNKWDILPIERNESIIEHISEVSREFCERIAKAYAVLQEGGTEDDVSEFCPPPDGSAAYTEFLRQKHRGGGSGAFGLIPATTPMVETALRYKQTKEKIRSLEEEKALYEQRLLEAIGDRDGIDLGSLGQITWKANKNGVRSLRATIKAEVASAEKVISPKDTVESQGREDSPNGVHGAEVDNTDLAPLRF